MSSHTEGPWHLEQRKKQTWVSGNGWLGLAKVITCLKDSHPGDACNNEGKANAKLLVAAPELLAALKALLLNREIGEYESQIQGLPRMIEVNEMARAAIAKAEGK